MYLKNFLVVSCIVTFSGESYGDILERDAGERLLTLSSTPPSFQLPIATIGLAEDTLTTTGTVITATAVTSATTEPATFPRVTRPAVTTLAATTGTTTADTTTTATTTPATMSSPVVSGNFLGFGLEYILRKVEEATSALKAGEIKTASYFFAKVDDAPHAEALLSGIVRENYTSEFYNDTLEFIGNIFNSSLRVKGYEMLVDLIIKDERNPHSKKDLLRLAHHLANHGGSSFPADELMTLTNRFSNGVKALVFSPHFTVKNIHDSYVLQYKQKDGEYLAITGKCKHCAEARLVASLHPDSGFYRISSKALQENGQENCLGVKRNRVVFRMDANHIDEICALELWQIKFVGKTLAMIEYHPQAQFGPGIGGGEIGFQPRINYTLEGYGITRTGFNQKVDLEAPQYLSSYQMWLVN